ncbi:MAG: hypothetical protein DRP64_03310 [Verrucomicrobia bacterium]|nr:MAG: hypothetical protein DRP64_03310 [Verrucomicrobiota bacterium]
MDVKYGKLPVPLSQDTFHALDYQIMGIAFNLHNETGNLWNEKEYRSELALRCRSRGLEVFEEVPVSIHHNGFRKTYFLDLLASGSVYELKTAASISENHEAQTLNSLFLTNTQHGKIIDFRQDSLTWRFVSTSLRRENRMGYSKAILHMSALNQRKNNLKNNLQKYLNRSSFNELLWINFNQNQIEFSSLHNSA